MIDSQRWRAVLLVMLGGMVALSAVAVPVTADETETSLEYEVVVTADGEVETLEILMTHDQETHGWYQTAASSEGYNNVSDMIGSGLVEQEPMFNDYTAEDRQVDSGYESQITFTDVDHTASENMSVTTDDGTVRWAMPNTTTTSSGQYDTFTFTAVMPGEITDSNADDVSGETATWNLTEGSLENGLYAESNADSGESGGDGGESGGDGLPGFGVTAALAAVLGAVALISRRAD